MCIVNIASYSGPPQHWKIIRPLGRGGCGDVLLCQDTDRGNFELVCKRIAVSKVSDLFSISLKLFHFVSLIGQWTLKSPSICRIVLRLLMFEFRLRMLVTLKICYFYNFVHLQFCKFGAMGTTPKMEVRTLVVSSESSCGV